MTYLTRLRFLIALIIAQAAIAACAATSPDTAAVVNGQPIPSHFYQVLVESSKRRAEQAGVPVVWDSSRGAKRLVSIQTSTIKRLVQNAIVDQLAKGKGVAVSDSELDAALTNVEAAFGGSSAVDQTLQQAGMTRDDYRSLYRYFLVDQKLRKTDPTGYATALDHSLKTAQVQVFVAPCTAEHDYGKCLGTTN